MSPPIRGGGIIPIRISAQSGDEREGAFLFQRLAVLMQRFNAILLHDSFESADHLG